MNEPNNWPAMIQTLLEQMVHKDNVLKLEVLESLHKRVGICLEEWRKRESTELLKLAIKAGLVLPQN